MWLPLGAFIALTTTIATRHEMWRDEVRAFSVATLPPSWSAMVSGLHQEGHPVIWYALLRVANEIAHTPLVLPVVALAVGAIAAFLILRFSPFPLWIRLLVVFGVFLGYEYSVVARNYGIGVVFMIAACIAFPLRQERPIPLALALALLANTSIHAAFASIIISLVWLADVLDTQARRELMRPVTGAAFAIVVAGVAVALFTARPSPDMAYAFSPRQLHAGQLGGLLFADPGRSLWGILQSGITAPGEFSVSRLGLDPDKVTRVLADIALLSLAWGLRKNTTCLAAMIVAIFGFETIFRFVYPDALRHEGILMFLLIALAWIAYASPSATSSFRRDLSLGMLPLLIMQSLALPVAARRDFLYPASSSKSLAKLISETPAYRNAIVMSEPDYFMEPIPYYVSNQVFMPRQGEFHHRVYFDNGTRRRRELDLGTLVNIADSLSCASRQPVLLSIGYARLLTDTAGEEHPWYRGTVFRWTGVERAHLMTRGKLVSSFPVALTDESYSVFEILPGADSSCATGTRK